MIVFLCDADGEGNEEAEDNMEEVDKNLDQMGTLLGGLNSMAQVSDSATRLPAPHLIASHYLTAFLATKRKSLLQSTKI
eukprot:COSAG02_NODE_2541_length_8576_cov_3.531202_11_plen_79_part_00